MFEDQEDSMLDYYDLTTQRGKKGKKKQTKELEGRNKQKIFKLEEITIPENITVKDFAAELKKTTAEVIKKLLGYGVMATINNEVDFDTAFLVAQEFGITAKKKETVTEEDILFDVSDFFKMLGDSTRAKIMWALDKHDMCVCDLAALLGMTKSAISHQLKTLRDANLVKFKKDGKLVIYSLDDDHVKDIFEKALEHVLEGKENK